MSNCPLKLYERPGTRSDRIKFMLEELNISYEKKTIDLSKREHKLPEFLEINPFGAIPVLEDKETQITLIESGAICTYLARKFKDKIFFPDESSSIRAYHDELMFFATSTLDSICLQINHHSKTLAPEKRVPSLVEDGKKHFSYCANYLNKILNNKKYVLGDSISAPDFIIATTLIWVRDDVEKHPLLQKYVQRILELPSMIKVRMEVKEYANKKLF